MAQYLVYVWLTSTRGYERNEKRLRRCEVHRMGSVKSKLQ
jgi:hypothetical protein